jgi:hypothetical protein
MTPSDRSKLARIVAHMLALRQPLATIESTLRSVSPGAEEADFADALAFGAAGRRLAELLNQGTDAQVLTQIGLAGGAVAPAWDVLIHFQVAGPSGPEWRSATARTAFGAGPADIRADAELARQGYTAKEYESPGKGRSGTVQLDPSAIEFEFVVPRFNL